MRISNFREPLCVVKIGGLICPEAAVQDVIHFRCSWKFPKTYRKTPVVESLCIKLQAYSLELY